MRLSSPGNAPGAAAAGSSRVRTCWAALALTPALALGAESFMPELQQQLQDHGVEVANAHLMATPASMGQLSQSAADCHPGAVELAVQLSRTKNTKAGDVHREALRMAVGACTELVLSLLTPKEVPKVCASVSSWTVTQTARELRRRIRQLDADERVRPIPFGKSCRAAYHFELHNTRVGLRAGPPAGAKTPK